MELLIVYNFNIDKHQHRLRQTSAPTINNFWWLNATQTSTRSEISDERIKKEIKDVESPLNKIMTLKPKEYYLCEKGYNKKFGIIAQHRTSIT